MSGIDTIKGIDYQVSYTLFMIVNFLAKREKNIEKFKFESLTEEEEDFNIFFTNGFVEYIQIKKKDEGYMWIPSEMKTVFAHYVNNYGEKTRFRFITNGSANSDVKKLKKYLNNSNKVISKKDIEKYLPENVQYDFFVKMLNSIKIETLVMVSSDDDISSNVKRETIHLMNSSSFFLNGYSADIYDKIWKYIFDLSKNGEAIGFIDLKRELNNLGLICVEEEIWLKFPKQEPFSGRKEELLNLNNIIENYNKISILGISGIGKSSLVVNWAQQIVEKKTEKVCWISLRANMTFSKLIKILGDFIEVSLNMSGFGEELAREDIANQVDKVLSILLHYRVIIIVDSYEKASGNILFFLDNMIKGISKEYKSILIITTTQRMDAYTDADKKLKRVYEYSLEGFTYDDVIDFYKEFNFAIDDIEEIWTRVGRYPIAHALLKSFLKDNCKFNLKELIDMTNEEKNQRLFERVYKELSKDEKEVLSYLSCLDYGFGKYEEKIIEKSIKKKINYIIRCLVDKNLLKFDGVELYLHDVIRELAYNQIIDDKKIEIHKIFMNIYHDRLFNNMHRREVEDDYLADKWGYHVVQLNNLEELQDDKLLKIIQLNESLRMDLWGIYWCGFPFEFEDSSLYNTKKRVITLKESNLVIEEKNGWKLDENVMNLEMLFLLGSSGVMVG